MHALDTLSPTARGVRAAPSARARLTAPDLHQALSPLSWLAAAVLVTAVWRMTGAAGEAASLALAGTASLVYLGTAVLAGRPLIAALDFAAAAISAAVAIGGLGSPATVMMIHALWGGLRASLGLAGPGRRFAAGWGIFFGASAVLFGLSV